MICAHCSKTLPDAANFCDDCGTAVAVAHAAPTPLAEQLPFLHRRLPESRPWVRYWARTIDIYLWTIFIGTAGGMVIGFYDAALLKYLDNSGLQLGVLLLWVLVESILLATIGTTPGKSLLKVRLESPQGGKPDFASALGRSFKVWWRGMGAGIPLVNLITLSAAYKKLKNEGQTSWDADGEFSVTHESIGAVRIFFTVALALAFLALVVMQR